MTSWTDGEPGHSSADDALHAARGLGAAIILAGIIYVPLVLWAIVGFGLHRGWW